MNRIEKRIRARKGKKLFCAYVTLGYPSVDFTKKLICEMDKAGVDFVELGFPFSDPLADGPVIQRASEFALRRGVSVSQALKLVRDLRKQGCEVPIIFFSYYNPIFNHGAREFAAELKRSGFDGVICPDLPPDEESEFPKRARKAGLSVIYLASPTTGSGRLKLIAGRSSGFIYYVSLKGVTGMRKALSSDLGAQIRRVRKFSKKPVLIGFGVSNAVQVAKAAAVSDGVIVGSAIVNAIDRSKKVPDVAKFIGSLVRAAGGRNHGHRLS